eukprot:4465040-Prymnesium_polylepis.1
MLKPRERLECTVPVVHFQPDYVAISLHLGLNAPILRRIRSKLVQGARSEDKTHAHRTTHRPDPHPGAPNLNAPEAKAPRAAGSTACCTTVGGAENADHRPARGAVNVLHSGRSGAVSAPVHRALDEVSSARRHWYSFATEVAARCPSGARTTAQGCRAAKMV